MCFLSTHTQIRDYNGGEEAEGGKEAEEMSQAALSRSSLAFSIMCMFLTVLYAGFAALVFAYSDDLLEENQNDIRAEVCVVLLLTFEIYYIIMCGESVII